MQKVQKLSLERNLTFFINMIPIGNKFSILYFQSLDHSSISVKYP